MGKRTNSSKFKGELTVELENEHITITTITKEAEFVYDLLAELESYNGKTVSISITEDKELEPIE